jgi:hypothetical protein
VDLTLHVADDNGLINLAGIVPPGAHYTAARNENTGVVRLTPVKVATTAVQLPAAAPADAGDPTPWDGDDPS